MVHGGWEYGVGKKKILKTVLYLLIFRYDSMLLLHYSVLLFFLLAFGDVIFFNAFKDLIIPNGGPDIIHENTGITVGLE